MSADTPGRDDEPALVLQVTPANYARRGLLAIVAGAVLAGVAVVLLVRGGDNVFTVLQGSLLVVLGISWRRMARRQVTSTLLRIDRDGLHSASGVWDRSWNGVALVWVGGSSGLSLPWARSSSISLFTRAGIDFARRAATAPAPLIVIPVGGRLRRAQLCERLRTVTSAEVVDGTHMSRRRAAAALLA